MKSREFSFNIFRHKVMISIGWRKANHYDYAKNQKLAQLSKELKDDKERV